MNATTLEAAVDDYLHLIVRTRPWTKRREEEALFGFVGWLQRTNSAEPTLIGVTPWVISAYAQSVHLSHAEQEQVASALANLRRWAMSEGLLPNEG